MFCLTMVAFFILAGSSCFLKTHVKNDVVGVPLRLLVINLILTNERGREVIKTQGEGLPLRSLVV
jgi:hypothetical protein